MADYHVLDSRRADRYRVAFHVAVPGETNAAGYSLRQAVSDQGPVTVVPWLPTAERDQITAGEVYEHVEVVEFSATLTNAQKRAVVDARHTTLSTSIPNELRDRFVFWGYDGTVA